MFRLLTGSLLALALTVAIAPVTAQAQPSGSYQQSCRNIRERSNGMLVALCPTTDGRLVRTEIDPDSCRARSRDIANLNGQLSCVRLNGGNAYGNRNGTYYGGNSYGLPGGSYQQSCTNAVVRGSMLTATCSAANGARITSSIDVARCRPGSDVSNIDGRLECLQYR